MRRRCRRPRRADFDRVSHRKGTLRRERDSFSARPERRVLHSGFAPHYEITDGVSASRWTSYDASIELPVSVEGGPLDLSYRFWRVFPETAISEVYLDEQLFVLLSHRPDPAGALGRGCNLKDRGQGGIERRTKHLRQPRQDPFSVRTTSSCSGRKHVRNILINVARLHGAWWERRGHNRAIGCSMVRPASLRI